MQTALLRIGSRPEICSMQTQFAPVEAGAPSIVKAEAIRVR